MLNRKHAVLVIPAFDPPCRIIALVKELRSRCGNWIIVVDDGSSEAYRKYFEILNLSTNVF